MIKKQNHCRICLSTDSKLLFTKDGYDIVQCNNCHLVFLNFAPDDKFLTDYYSKNFFHDSGSKHGFSNYETESKNLQKTFKQHIEILRKYQNNGNLLDIGCATGTFMEEAVKYWQVYGVEISSYASGVAKQKKLKVFTGKLEESPYKKQKFNIVTLWDTIEHLPDPLATMGLIFQMTEPDGIIALTTGDIGSRLSKVSGRFWHLYNIPQHLSFFNRKTITHLLSKSGFKVKEITYPDVNFTLDYLLFRLITFYKLKFAFPVYLKLKKKLLHINFKINIGDIMLVIAQKKWGEKITT